MDGVLITIFCFPCVHGFLFRVLLAILLFMHKILFVCHGNICRSPMAEMVMKHLVRQAGRERDFVIDSAAARRDEIGNGMHRGTRTKLVREQIPFTEHYARLVTRADYATYDLIICMDEENMEDLDYLFSGDGDGKVHKLLEYCGSTRDVADPWYTGNFDATFSDVMAGCTALLASLQNNAF